MYGQSVPMQEANMDDISILNCRINSYSLKRSEVFYLTTLATDKNTHL
jgi:hypothetical protein